MAFSREIHAFMEIITREGGLAEFFVGNLWSEVWLLLA
jgi:hypothetical protein